MAFDQWVGMSRLNFVKSYRSKEKCLVCNKYLKYLNKNDTIVFNILYANKQARFYFSATIITKVSLFGYIIFSSVDTHDWFVPNKLSLTIMSLERWNFTCVMAEMMVNTMTLVWWRYPKYLRRMTIFSLELYELPHYIAKHDNLCMERDHCIP